MATPAFRDDCNETNRNGATPANTTSGWPKTLSSDLRHTRGLLRLTSATTRVTFDSRRHRVETAVVEQRRVLRFTPWVAHTGGRVDRLAPRAPLPRTAQHWHHVLAVHSVIGWQTSARCRHLGGEGVGTEHRNTPTDPVAQPRAPSSHAPKIVARQPAPITEVPGHQIPTHHCRKNIHGRYEGVRY